MRIWVSSLDDFWELWLLSSDHFWPVDSLVTSLDGLRIFNLRRSDTPFLCARFESEVTPARSISSLPFDYSSEALNGWFSSTLSVGLPNIRFYSAAWWGWVVQELTTVLGYEVSFAFRLKWPTYMQWSILVSTLQSVFLTLFRMIFPSIQKSRLYSVWILHTFWNIKSSWLYSH